MEEPRKTSLTLTYNSTNISGKISQYLQSCTYTDVASGETDTLTLNLTDKEHKWINDWFPVEGDYLEATINVTNWIKTDDNRKLKCGKFLIDDYSFSGPPDVYKLSAISSPVDTDFSSTEKSKTWSNVTTKSVAKTIAESAGLTLYYDADVYTIKKLEQSSKSDMSFLFDTCQNYNLGMKLYNSKIVIFDEIKYEQKEAVGTIKKSDCDSYSLNGTLVGIYHGVSIKYTDSDTNKTLSYKYMIVEDGKRILKVNQKAESYSDAEIKAKAQLRKKNKTAMAITLTLKGDTKYLAGTCYNITGFGKYNGKYYIDKVTHAISSGYQASLEMHKVLNISLYDTSSASSDSTTGLAVGDKYKVVTKLTGYYTSAEAKSLTATNQTGSVYPGTYYIYNIANSMINVTKVKGSPGSWINPGKNVS